MPRRRDDLLLSWAVDAFGAGDHAGALLAVESVCRGQPAVALPAILRAKLVAALLPGQTPAAWLAAWEREPGLPALQDALLRAWLAAGRSNDAAELGLAFLPGRCIEGTHASLLPLLRQAGVAYFGACWKDGGAIVAMACIDAAPGAPRRARVHLHGPDGAAEFEVPADGRFFCLPQAGGNGEWSLVLGDGATACLLAGSPLSFRRLPTPRGPAAARSPAAAGATADVTTGATAGVTIIVPVHRGLESVRQCIGSVLASLPRNRTPSRLLVVDDASPEPALSAWLDEQAAAGSLVLLRNRWNLGFIETVNRALRHCNNGDVLLLNADTLVHGDWVDRLRRAAAAAPDIAAVSPWSNNGEITSFPDAGRAGPMPDPAQVARIDAAAAALGSGDVALPACCGFAMLMRRAALDDIGPLDGATLQRGYGEEVDWCLRARAAGYRILAATGVYVGHAGGASFRHEKRLRVRQNRATLAARWPDYYPEYQRFLRDDPLQAARAALRAVLGDDGAAPAAAAVAPAAALAATCVRIGVWQVPAGTPQSAAVLRLARLLARARAGLPPLRLLVFGAAGEALCHTGVADVLPTSADPEALLDDGTMAGLAGCAVLLAMPGQQLPEGIPVVRMAPGFDAAAWLAAWTNTAEAAPMTLPPLPLAATSLAPTALASITRTGDAAIGAASRWSGALEGAQDAVLYGWAVDRNDPDARVVVEIRLADEFVGVAVADVARPDLADALREALGPEADDCHGFVFDLPALSTSMAGMAGMLSAAIANSGWRLPGAVRHEDATPAPVTGFVSGAGGLRLQGWLMPGQGGNVARMVRAYLHDHVVAEARADRRLPLLRGRPAQAHGFQLDLPAELADGQPHSVRVVDQDGQPLPGSPVAVCCYLEGVRALLPGHAALLGPLIESYERAMPRCLGMAHYRAWADTFERDDGPARSGALRVGLIVHGHAGGEAGARTAASLARQTHRAHGMFADAPFATLLQAALASPCDVIACVRAGDTLPPQALALALEGLALPGAQVVYGDSEMDGRPWFKPAWDPSYALATDYPLELMLARAEAVRAMMARDAATTGNAANDGNVADGADDANTGGAVPADAAALAWRLLAAVPGDAIVHVPRILYRVERALDEGERRQRDAAAAAALRAFDPDAALAPAPSGAGMLPRQVARALRPQDRGMAVTLVIPTRDQAGMLRRCIDSIVRHTAWPALEIMVVDNGSEQPETRDYLGTLRRRGITVLERPGRFNFAALNNDAVAHARGDIVGLVNDDIEALHDGWLDAMVAELLRPGVGAVGAKLLWPNGMVQHGGVLLGIGNVAGHFGNALADDDWGDHWRNRVAQRVSAVTAACMVLRKADYLALGGMDAQAFPVAFNDVDLCLKLRAAGKAIVWTPQARLQHAESATRGRDDTPQRRARAQREIDCLRLRWGAVLQCDPAYHPSLTLDVRAQAFGGLAMPPRPRLPRTAALPPAGPPCA